MVGIRINPQVSEKYPTFQAGFALAYGLGDYASPEERARAEEAIVAAVNERFTSVEEAEAHYLNDLYLSFYKSMGLKRGAMTPLAPVSRVIKNQAHRSIHRAIDIYLVVEYTSLVSAQVYDADKIKGDLEYRFAIGDETLTTFHQETKLARKGELILVDDEGLVHSPYYGNNADKSIDGATSRFLFRIMGIPGIHQEDFDVALHRISLLANYAKFVVVSQAANYHSLLGVEY